MTAWILVALAISGQSGGDSADSQSLNAPPREVHAIRKEVSDLLRQESAAVSEAARFSHLRRMTEVYLEIVRDDRWATNSALQQQRNKMWSRLSRVRDELKRREATAQRNDSATDDDRAEHELASAMSVHFQLASQTLGGSASVFEVAGGGVIDDSQTLIDLIQSTIDPSHWNVNGGPGSIVYYRPAMALVVRAASEVHSDVGGVVGALRAAR